MWVHAPRPQGVQLGRREVSGQDIESIDANAEQRSCCDDTQPRSDQLDAHCQRSPRHLSSHIAADHPLVTEDHDQHREDGKGDDTSSRGGPLPHNDKYQGHEAYESGSNDRP